MARELTVHWAKEQRTISTCKGTNNGTSMDYEPAYSTVDCRRVESAHAINSTLTLPLLLLRVEAVHVFIHNGVSMHICRRFLRRGYEKKTTENTESFFLFRFFWATEKPTLKSRFSVAKNRKKTTKKTTIGFRFTALIPTNHGPSKRSIRVRRFRRNQPFFFSIF